MQKNVLKIILGDAYIDYDSALHLTGLGTLDDRRTKLCLKFAKSSLENDQTSDMFPVELRAGTCLNLGVFKQALAQFLQLLQSTHSPRL